MDVDARDTGSEADSAAGATRPIVGETSRPARLWPVLVILAVAAGCYVTVGLLPGMLSGVPWALRFATTGLTLLALAVWLLLFSRFAARVKWGIFVPAVAILAIVAYFFRVNVTGDLVPSLGLRWHASNGPTIDAKAGPVDLKTTTKHDVPGFLGPGRRPQYPAVPLDLDWAVRPPRQLWKQPIGEGFSSFAVVGDFAVTQEQAGSEELVVCYEWRTGRPRWKFTDAIYFTSSLGGVGPRATPTIDGGRVYAMGSTGILNCLDGSDGHRLWSHDVRTDNQAKNLEWGFSCSPLIVDNLVVVSAGVRDPAVVERKVPFYTLIAYDKQTGAPVWHSSIGDRKDAERKPHDTADGASFCSPSLATLAGVRQIVIANANSVASYDVADGHLLWDFAIQRNFPTVSQVVPLGDDRVFESKGYGAGCGVYQIRHDAAGKWSADKIWSESNLMRTKFTNVVIRDGYAYGLNDGFLECISLDKGTQRWTARRNRVLETGHGQVLLVGDLLLVQTEQGEIVLVEATPERLHEVARFSALSGRTWNYPVLIDNYLLTRNDREAACFELPLKSR